MIRLSKKLKTLFTDTISIVIRVVYDIEVFESAENIEVAYQVAYQKIIRNGNYLELSEKEIVIQLLSYIENTSYLKLSKQR